MPTQTWKSKDYANYARFVTDLGAPVLELLAPKPGEHILDLGCGDGVLTKQIAPLAARSWDWTRARNSWRLRESWVCGSSR